MGARNPDSPGPETPRRKRAIPRDASCTITMGKGAARVVRRGVAALTADELRFNTGRTGRGGTDFFVHLRFEQITALAADGPAGTLTVTTDEHGTVVFQLGRLAAAWKAIIDERPDLLRELGVAARTRVALVGVDDEAVVQALAARGLEPVESDVDVLFAGAEHPADLTRLPALAGRVKPGGVIWVVHQPDTRGLDREAIVAAARAARLVDGKTVELSAGRLALRLVVPSR